MTILVQAGVLALEYAVTVGPFLALTLLLNRRDRRPEGLLGVLWQATPWELRSRIAVRTRLAILSSRGTAIVSMPDGSWEERQEAVQQWRPYLPPRTRLLVEGRLARGVPGWFFVETVCPPPASRWLGPSLQRR